MTDEYVKTTCKIGQGAACCRYLVMGQGFECAKITNLKTVIDARVERMNAQGNNCEGHVA